MSQPLDEYHASVSDLLNLFHEALIALLPFADRAMINYSDLNTHKDWEALSESLFDAFVRSAIDSRQGLSRQELPLVRYDIDLEEYASVSWISIVPESPHRGVFVRFLSDASPLDSIQVVDIDSVSLRAGKRRVVGTNEAQFAFVCRSTDGDTQVVRNVVVDD